MRSLLSTEPGGPETLVFSEDMPMPEPSDGDVRIAVRSTALNLPDLLMIQDLYQNRPPRPFAPGAEVAGIVDAIGASVSGFTLGQRVMAVTSSGGLADYVCAPATKVSLIPAAMPFDHAAAFLITYATAWHGLQERGGLKPGETLLVLGASGGVGLAAIELGKAMGARVLAGVSSTEKLDIAKAAGADDGIVYPSGPLSKAQQRQFSTDLKTLAGPEGIDVVFDPVGGDYVEPAFRAMGWKGRYLVIGFAAGITSLPMNLPLLKGADILGVYWAEAIRRDPDAHQETVQELCALYENGQITPRIHATYPFAQSVDALHLLASRKATGKIVVTL